VLPTVADVLDMDVVRRGVPKVIAGTAGLTRPVRWVHVSEVPDIASMLRGGELVLTTGIALPEEPTGLTRYVADLAGVGVVGLVIELGRRYVHTPPDALVQAADHHELPLVVLHRETPFVQITEAVHERIVDAQLSELRRSEQIHEVFTALSVEGAEPVTVVREVAGMARCPVVLEDLAHRVLAFDAAGADPTELLEGWEARSHRATTAGRRTTHDPETGLLTTVVGARGEDWGRLVLVCGAPGDPPPEAWLFMLAERAATTLALIRLLDRDRESLERQAHRDLLADLLRHGARSAGEVAARARTLGVPLRSRRLLGVVLRPRMSGTDGIASLAVLRNLAEQFAAAARAATVPALVGPLGGPDAGVGALLAVRRDQDEWRVLDTLTDAVRTVHVAPEDDPVPVVIAAGSVVDSVTEAQRSLQEAQHVAEVISHLPHVGDRRYHRLSDLRLRALMHLLREDPRLQTFVERELAPLLWRPEPERKELLHVLSTLLDSGGNKLLTARRLHLSRPALYARLERLERLLGVDLDDPESRTSLHVALLARDALTG